MSQWIYGLLNLPWWGYVVYTLALTHITILGVTLYLHRSQSHRAMDFHPIVSHFFRFWLWLTTGMVTKEFVAIHRKHHTCADKEGDPHSPVLEGISTLLTKGVELYRLASRKVDIIERFGHGTPDDWIERKIYTPFSKFGILLMFIIDLVLLGVPGITVWAIQMAWIPFWATGMINGGAHHWGYRNYECADAATNLIPWGILIGGEELHNNHHTYGTSAKFSVKWWEFDMGWFVVCLLKPFGLVKVNRMAPSLASDPQKGGVDLETIKAIIANRVPVLTQYTRRVLMPVFNEAQQQASPEKQGMFQQAKQWFKRERSLVKAADQAAIHQVLEGEQRLKQVYQLRDSLQDIWEKTTASQRELIDSLQEWCRQAEQCGIDALNEFVLFLKACKTPAAS